MLSTQLNSLDWTASDIRWGPFHYPLVTLLIARCLAGVYRRLCMFETKENTSGEIKSTTFLGSGREPCQQAVQDFLGERLSHILKFSFLSI